MKKIIFLLVLLNVAMSWAKKADEDPWKDFENSEIQVTAQSTSTWKNSVKFVISPLAVEKRIESSTNPVLEGRNATNFALGLRNRKSLYSIEYSQFSQATGNDTFAVERRFQDLLGWYRYAFVESRYLRGMSGLGAGFYQEEVTTQFYGAKQVAGSGAKWTGAVGLGVEIEPLKWIVFLFEGRLIAGQNLDPNPNTDFLARASIQF